VIWLAVIRHRRFRRLKSATRSSHPGRRRSPCNQIERCGRDRWPDGLDSKRGPARPPLCRAWDRYLDCHRWAGAIDADGRVGRVVRVVHAGRIAQALEYRAESDVHLVGSRRIAAQGELPLELAGSSRGACSLGSWPRSRRDIEPGPRDFRAEPRTSARRWNVASPRIGHLSGAPVAWHCSAAAAHRRTRGAAAAATPAAAPTPPLPELPATLPPLPAVTPMPPNRPAGCPSHLLHRLPATAPSPGTYGAGAARKQK